MSSENIPLLSSKKSYRHKKLSESNQNGSICNDDYAETYELQQRERKAQVQEVYPKELSKNVSNSNIIGDYETLVDRIIQQGESLASIALKYRIPVSELKRVNHLQKDMEFYALKSLKIPVKTNSSLMELLQSESSHPGEQNQATALKLSSSSHALKLSSSVSSELDSESDIPTGVVSISQILREKHSRREAKEFLKNMQKDLVEIQSKTASSYKESLEEASQALTDVRFMPLQGGTSGSGSSLKCSGADMDFSWRKVIAVGLCIGVITPVVYFLYFMKHHG